MAHIQYIHEEGALHIGGGRFFFAKEPVEVSDEEALVLLENYSDLQSVVFEEKIEKHTKDSLKKLNKEAQEALIVELSGNPEDTRNEAERIALILNLQG